MHISYSHATLHFKIDTIQTCIAPIRHSKLIMFQFLNTFGPVILHFVGNKSSNMLSTADYVANFQGYEG